MPLRSLLLIAASVGLLLGCKTHLENTTDPTPAHWSTFDLGLHAPITEDATDVRSEVALLSYQTVISNIELSHIVRRRLTAYGWQLSERLPTTPNPISNSENTMLLWFEHPQRSELLSVHVVSQNTDSLTRQPLRIITMRLQTVTAQEN